MDEEQDFPTAGAGMDTPLLNGGVEDDAVSTGVAPLPSRKKGCKTFCCGCVAGTGTTTLVFLTVLAIVGVGAFVMLRPGTNSNNKDNQEEDPTGSVVTEKDTGKHFKTIIPAVAGSEKHVLLGVASRHVSLTPMALYAMGVYVEPTKAAPALKDFRAEDMATRRTDEKYFAELMSGKFSRTIRMVVNTNLITIEIFKKIVDAELRPEVNKRVPNQDDANKMVDAFCNSYSGKSIGDDTEMILTCSADPADDFYQMYNGEQIGLFKANKALCDAFFAIYIGPTPIDAGMRSNFATFLDGVYDFGKVSETESGYSFASSFTNALSGVKESMLGVGARHLPSKWRWPWQPKYTVAGAVALYVNAVAARPSLLAWKGKEATDIVKEQSYFDTVANGAFAKTVWVKPSVDVTVAALLNVWLDLEPTLVKRYGADTARAVADATVQAMESVVGATLGKGVDVVLSCTPSGEKFSLAMSVQEKRVETPVASDDEVCWALWQSLVGPDTTAVDPQLKNRYADVSANWI